LNDKSQESAGFSKLMVVNITVIVKGLDFMNDLLIPCAFAGLLAFILAPSTTRLTVRGVPSPVASGITVGTSALLVVGLLYLVSSQAIDLASRLPEYRDNLITRIKAVKSSTGGSLNTMSAAVETIKQEIEKPADSSAATQPVAQTVKVEVVNPDSGMIQTAGEWFTPLAAPVGIAMIVFVLTYFMLEERQVIGTRFIRIARQHGWFMAAEGAEEAADRVGRYLRAQFAISCIYGVTVTVIMLALGLPSALLWGLIAGALRYIPYIGPLIGIALPTALALATQTGWTIPLVTLGMLLILEAVTNLILEPKFYGSSTGVSALGVLLSAAFWGWIWGGPGLLLGLPITVVIVVFGRHFGPLRPLSELLLAEEIDEPADRAEVERPEILPLPLGIASENSG